MAWPPPVLATNRTDATDQQATHPADHNAANLAINDIVARLTALNGAGFIYNGSTPGGDCGVGAQITVARVPGLPAGTYLLSYAVLLASTSPVNLTLRVYNGATTIYDHKVTNPATTVAVSLSMPFTFAAGADLVVNVINQGAAPVSTYADPLNHRIAAMRGYFAL